LHLSMSRSISPPCLLPEVIDCRSKEAILYSFYSHNARVATTNR